MTTHRISESGINKFDLSNVRVLASPGVVAAWADVVNAVERQADRDEMRTLIQVVEDELMKMPQADHGLEHLFPDGLYVRVARIFPGTLFTTPIYREECVLTMLRGHIGVVTDCGVSTAKAGDFVITKPGTKRIIFAMDDVLAHTVHPNPKNIRDVGILESRIYVNSFSELEVI